jgi:hypothetical protein
MRGQSSNLAKYLPVDDDEDVTDAKPWRLDTLAENEGFSKEIDRFAKRVSALRTDQEPGPGEVQKLADLCLGVIPAFAGAQRWYREQCAQHGWEFAVCRDEWRASASDEMLDHEHEVVFFDQSSISHEFQALESLAHHSERLALGDPVRQIWMQSGKWTFSCHRAPCEAFRRLATSLHSTFSCSRCWTGSCRVRRRPGASW